MHDAQAHDRMYKCQKPKCHKTSSPSYYTRYSIKNTTKLQSNGVRSDVSTLIWKSRLHKASGFTQDTGASPTHKSSMRHHPTTTGWLLQRLDCATTRLNRPRETGLLQQQRHMFLSFRARRPGKTHVDSPETSRLRHRNMDVMEELSPSPSSFALWLGSGDTEPRRGACLLGSLLCSLSACSVLGAVAVTVASPVKKRLRTVEIVIFPAGRC